MCLRFFFGLFLVRRIFNVRDLVSAHEISGQYLSIVGTMYAVLLGLIVVDAMARFQQAITAVEQEANSLSELIFLAGRMPQAQRVQVQESAVKLCAAGHRSRMGKDDARGAPAGGPRSRHRSPATLLRLGAGFGKRKGGI